MAEERGWLQRIVQDLMQTLLEDHPTLLSDTEKSSLMDADYCKNALGLKLSFPLLSNTRRVNGQARYWNTRCGGYYICSEWQKDRHHHNARMLWKFVDRLVNNNPSHPGVHALKTHGEALKKNNGTAGSPGPLTKRRPGEQQTPKQCAWHAYAAAAITGLIATHGKVSIDEVPGMCDLASSIADEMIKREAEREPEVEEED